MRETEGRKPPGAIHRDHFGPLVAGYRAERPGQNECARQVDDAEPRTRHAGSIPIVGVCGRDEALLPELGSPL